MTINSKLNEIKQWALDDYCQYPFRFTVEIIAWLISIACSITMALTVPTPPLILIYPAWIIGCAMYAWAAWTRGSFGMLMNYLVLMTIDAVGLLRMVM